MTRRTPLTLALVGAALAVGTAGVVPASAHGGSEPAAAAQGTLRLAADLDALNSSGVDGTVTVRSTRRDPLRHIRLEASGLTPDGPHAVHIHYGEQAAHECPTVHDDANGDFRVNVVEGLPQYGPIAVSLTRRGDTSAASALALERMPVAEDGLLRYSRYSLPVHDLTDADGDVVTPAAEVAAAIRAGEGVVVVHGIDYSSDGAYGESAAGPSELDPEGQVPAEATDPAACGVLARVH